MIMLRLWDAYMVHRFTTKGDSAPGLRSEAEQFLASYEDSDWLYWTVDFSDPPSHRTRQGGRLTQDGSGFRWEDNRDLLSKYILPNPPDLSGWYSLANPPVPGDRIAVEFGGVIYTDTIESIHTETPKRDAQPAPRPPWWRRVLHALTPRRYREPELWAPPGGSTASTVITTVGDGQPYMLGRDIVLGERHDLTDPAYWTDQPE